MSYHPLPQWNVKTRMLHLTNQVPDQQKLYHCPGPRCSREFTSLASIINHLESEVCGFVRFEEVQESFGDIIIPGCPLPF